MWTDPGGAAAMRVGRKSIGHTLSFIRLPLQCFQNRVLAMKPNLDERGRTLIPLAKLIIHYTIHYLNGQVSSIVICNRTAEWKCNYQPERDVVGQKQMFLPISSVSE